MLIIVYQTTQHCIPENHHESHSPENIKPHLSYFNIIYTYSIYNEILHPLNILLRQHNLQAAAAVIQIIQPIPIKNFGILHWMVLEIFHVVTMFVMLITWELEVKN
jgi:hypothetical protein